MLLYWLAQVGSAMIGRSCHLGSEVHLWYSHPLIHYLCQMKGHLAFVKAKILACALKRFQVVFLKP